MKLRYLLAAMLAVVSLKAITESDVDFQLAQGVLTSDYVKIGNDSLEEMRAAIKVIDARLDELISGKAEQIVNEVLKKEPDQRVKFESDILRDIFVLANQKLKYHCEDGQCEDGQFFKRNDADCAVLRAYAGRLVNAIKHPEDHGLHAVVDLANNLEKFEDAAKK